MTTNEILQYHDQFASLMARQIGDASLMAQRIDDASSSQYDFEDDHLETTRLAHNIRKASASLATNVENMKYELKTFVSVLRKEKVGSLVERIVRWLKSLIGVIKTIFATIFSSDSDTDRHRPIPEKSGSRIAETPLGQAAAEFCKVDPGAFLEHIILPLQGQK